MLGPVQLVPKSPGRAVSCHREWQGEGRQEHAGCFRGTRRNRRNRVVLGGRDIFSLQERVRLWGKQDPSKGNLILAGVEEQSFREKGIVGSSCQGGGKPQAQTTNLAYLWHRALQWPLTQQREGGRKIYTFTGCECTQLREFSRGGKLAALMSVLVDLPEDKQILSRPIPSEVSVYNRQWPLS